MATRFDFDMMNGIVNVYDAKFAYSGFPDWAGRFRKGGGAPLCLWDMKKYLPGENISAEDQMVLDCFKDLGCDIQWCPDRDEEYADTPFVNVSLSWSPVEPEVYWVNSKHQAIPVTEDDIEEVMRNIRFYRHDITIKKTRKYKTIYVNNLTMFAANPGLGYNYSGEVYPYDGEEEEVPF